MNAVTGATPSTTVSGRSRRSRAGTRRTNSSGPQKYIPSGQEDLTDQLHLAVPEGLERSIGEYIVGSLNEDGLLGCTIAEIATYFDVEEAAVEAVLRIIQGFDPPGVAARDLQECLLLQLEAPGAWPKRRKPTSSGTISRRSRTAS